METNAKKTVKLIAKSIKWVYLEKLITSLIIRGVLLILPIVLSYYIEFAGNGVVNTAVTFAIIAGVISVGRFLAEIWNQKAFYDVYNKTYQCLNDREVRKTYQNSQYSLSRFTASQFHNTLTSDVDTIAAFIGYSASRIIQIIELFIIYAYFLSLNFYIFLGAVFVSVLILIIMPKANRAVEKDNHERKKQYDALTASNQEYFTGIKDIKNFHIYDAISNRVRKRQSKFLEATSKYVVHYSRNNNLFLALIEAFRWGTLALSVYLVTQGMMTEATLLIIYNYYQKIIDNYGVVLTIGVEISNLKVSWNRINKLFEYSHHIEPETPVIPEKNDGVIEFKDIVYGNKNAPALNHVSYTFGPNSFTTITGPNVNKAAFYELIMKHNRQHSGSVLIDGVDINDIPGDNYFSRVSMVDKEPAFFFMSIIDNLMLVCDDEERIYEICKRVGVHDLIMELPDGYNTNMLATDVVVSQTIKLLVAFVRCFVKNTKVIFIDECLGALSEEHQNVILDYLFEIKKERTIVVVSNIQSVIDKSDHVYYFN